MCNVSFYLYYNTISLDARYIGTYVSDDSDLESVTHK